jgi:DNA-directed RNA polymerase specialized sigma24 family protein
VDTANTQVSPHAADAVTALYAEHAFGLVRLAVVVLGDQAAAEDVVQDAFLGLYRRWDSLADASHPLAYVRTSVLNGCRSVLRRRSRHGLTAVFSQPPVLLRYYLDMSEDEIARTMGISRGTVKSATSRALAAIGRILAEES